MPARDRARTRRPADRATGRTEAQARFRTLRSAHGEESADRLLLATLKVRIPKVLWTSGFSRSHPEISLEVLNRSDVSRETSVSDYWIGGHPAGVWAREIAGYADVLAVDSLAEVGDGCLYRITYRNPPVISLYRELGMPIQFPLHIQAGSIHWEVVARRVGFDTVLRHAKKIDPDFQVISIRRRPLRHHLPVLTDAQHQLLTRAMASGYFAVPRGITLTELARRLDRSKSAVSEAIAIIERKLLESALRPTSLP